MPRIRLTLVRSKIGHNPRNRATVEALGLRKVNHTVEKEDTPSLRGMVHAVKELLLVEELGDNGESRVVFDARSIKRRAKGSARGQKPNEQHRGGSEQTNT